MPSNIKQIKIDLDSVAKRNTSKERLQRTVTDLIEESTLYIEDKNEINKLNIRLVANKFTIELTSDNKDSKIIAFPISPLRKIIKDYAIICDNYFDAVNNNDSRKVEAIDMGRRGAHNEGAQIIEDMISGQINIDFETLRKLFSLVFIITRK